MFETTDVSARPSDPEPVMSIGDFVDMGLEPGQSALLWDYDRGRYVSVAKPTHPPGRLIHSLLMPLMAHRGLSHGFVGMLPAVVAACTGGPLT